MADGAPAGLRYPWDTPPDNGSALEVADGVLWARLPLPMKLDHVNVYALDDGDSWTVIDTGFASRKTKALWQGLLDGPMGGKPVGRVIVTHHHPDHVGLAGWFQTEHGAELLTTRTAWLMARMLTLDEQPVPAPESIAFWRSAGMDSDILAERSSERPFNFADIVAPMPLGYTRLQQGAVIRMGGRDWDVHMGNGHAPEHATFWSRDDNLVLSGDQILPSISPNIGVYATEPMADPIGEWLEACERLARLAREDHLVLGGHKLPFTGLPTRMRQLIDNHHHALDRLLTFLDTPKSASECFAPLFKRAIGAGEYGLALVEAVAHLSHLFQDGRASRTLRSDGVWVYQRKDRRLGETIKTMAEAQEAAALPQVHEVHSDADARNAADQPVPDAVRNTPPEKKSPARWAYERIILYLQNFEASLDNEHEVAIGLTGGDVGVLRIEGMGYFDPDIVTFYGRDPSGAQTQLIQHVTQLNVMLRAMPKQHAQSKPRRIGFRLIQDLENKKPSE